MIAILEQVTKYYQLGDVRITALHEVSLALKKDEFAALAGPSGSGKSTLLHLLGCIDKPSKGRIIIDGVDTTPLSLEELRGLRHNRIGFIFQSFNLIPVLTAFENVELPLLFKKINPSKIKDMVEEILFKVGLADRKDHYPAQLSGGQLQRVAIARAIVGHPQLILADEPTANLDSKTGGEIIDLLFRLNQEEKAAILIATHDQGILKKINTIFGMHDGKIYNSRCIQK